MEPRFLTFNAANFVTVNLMVLLMAAIVMAVTKWNASRG
jgi:hypothetical protein